MFIDDTFIICICNNYGIRVQGNVMTLYREITRRPAKSTIDKVELAIQLVWNRIEKDIIREMSAEKIKKFAIL